MRALLAALLLFIACGSQAQLFGTAERGFGGGVVKNVDFLPVDQAYQLQVEILDAHNVHLYWQIAPHYYLYRHRFEFSLADGKGGEIAVQPTIPAG